MKPRAISPYPLLVATLLLLAPLPATAQVSLASQHGDLGDRAIAGQQHATALTEYVLAYAYDSTAERLMKIASTYQAMGNAAVAIELYDRVAVLAGSRPVAVQARSQANGLRGANAAPMKTPGTLSLLTIPPGGEVWVDGQLQGSSPIPPISLQPGEHTVLVRLTGFQDWTKMVTITSGAGVNEMASLLPGVAGTGSPTPATRRTTLVTNPMEVGVIQTRHNSLSGQWHSYQFAPDTLTAIQRTGQLNLRESRGQAGHHVGEFVVAHNQPLTGYRRRQCGGQTEVKWTVTYQVTASVNGANPTWTATNGTLRDCTCEAMCQFQDEYTTPLLIAPDKAVIVSANMIFERGASPGQAPSTVLTPSLVNGQWDAQFYAYQQVASGTVQFDSQGSSVSGQLRYEQSIELGWRRRNCNNQRQVQSTFVYNGEGELNSTILDFKLTNAAPDNCPCQPTACEAATQLAKPSNPRLRLTSDSRHLAGPNTLLTRTTR